MDSAKEQIRLNRSNISNRMDIISKLQDVRDELELMLNALEKRR